jgi:hypothetical protein
MGSRPATPNCEEAPGVIDLAACVDDLGSVELLSGGLLEWVEDTDDSIMHDVLPAAIVFVYHMYAREGHFIQLVLAKSFTSTGLMSFPTVSIAAHSPVTPVAEFRSVSRSMKPAMLLGTPEEAGAMEFANVMATVRLEVSCVALIWAQDLLEYQAGQQLGLR